MPGKAQTKPHKKIREIMHATFRSIYDEGRPAKTSEVVALVKSDHPELIKELQDTLTTRALLDLAAQIAGTWRSVADKGERQLVIPGMSKDVLEQLPPALSVPFEGNVRDIAFIPAQAATFAQWKAHLKYQLSRYKGLGLVVAAIQELIEHGNQTSCPGDRALLPWLAEQASSAKESRKSLELHTVGNGGSV